MTDPELNQTEKAKMSVNTSRDVVERLAELLARTRAATFQRALAERDAARAELSEVLAENDALRFVLNNTRAEIAALRARLAELEGG